MGQNRSRGAAPRPLVLVRPTRLDPAGVTGPTRGQARGSRWRRVGHGRYVPSQVGDDLPEQRIPVPLATGARARLRPAPGVRLLRNDLPPAEVTTALGVSCTTPERAALDAVRCTKGMAERVVVLDMLMLAELTSLQRLRQYVADHAGLPGIPLLTDALDLAHENSWSPNETRTRMIWVGDARLPRPLVNVPIFDRRGPLAGRGAATLDDDTSTRLGPSPSAGGAHRGA